MFLHALEMYKPTAMNQETVVMLPDNVGRVRVAGRKQVLIPARTIKVIEGSVRAAANGQRYTASSPCGWAAKQRNCWRGIRWMTLASANLSSTGSLWWMTNQ